MASRRNMFLVFAAAALAAIVATILLIEWRNVNRTVADTAYEPTIRAPLFDGKLPLLLFDEAHRNHHRLDGTYRPFQKLATAVGFKVEPLRKTPAAKTLDGAAVLMVVTAQGPTDPGDQPAFSSRDIAAIRDFVSGGGGLILAVDHYPFADAAQGLANTFGVELSRGMTMDAEHADKSVKDDSQLVFSRQNGLLASHPITDGQAGGGVESVVVFTAVTMSVPVGATRLLATGANATDLVPSARVEEHGGDKQTIVEYGESRPAQGRAIGIAMNFGRGRIAILGDCGMLTAQYDRKKSRKYGFTSQGFDDERFTVNLLSWVAQRDVPTETQSGAEAETPTNAQKTKSKGDRHHPTGPGTKP